MASLQRARGSGSVPYREAEALQRAVHEHADDDYLLLQEHPHVYTLGSSADARARAARSRRRSAPSSCTPIAAATSRTTARASSSATRSSRSPSGAPGSATSSRTCAGSKSVLIAVLADFGIAATRSDGLHGCVGRRREDRRDRRAGRARPHPARLRAQRRSRPHDVRPHRPVRHPPTVASRRWRGCSARAPSMRDVVDRVVARFAEAFGFAAVDRQDVAWKAPRRSSAPIARRRRAGRVAGAAARPARGRRGRAPIRRSARTGPEWMRVRARFDDGYLELKKLMRGLELHTVCEEAGCPNIYECWADRTATFMILGDRCTRACGFCLVDTRKPLAGRRRRAAPRRRGGRGAGPRARGDHVRRARRPPRRRRVGVRGDGRRGPRRDQPRNERRAADLRLQGRRRRARDDLRGAARRAEPQPRDRRPPPARGAPVGRVRALAGGARAAPRTPGSSTKSGLILGMGETVDEVRAAIADLRGVGVDILTIGQYLRPSAAAPAGRAVVDARRVRRGPRVRRGRSASVTSSRARSCARATTPAPQSSRPRRDRAGRRLLTEWARWPRRCPRSTPISPRWLRAQPMFFVATAPPAEGGHVNVLAEGLRHVPRARRPTGRVPRPDRQRRRDDRAPARERSDHADVLRVRRQPAHLPALRPRAPCTSSDRRGSTRSRGEFPTLPGARGRSSRSTSTGSRRRAATRCR